MRRLAMFLLLSPVPLACLIGLPSATGADPADQRPLMREFIGVNGHTVQFRPALYAAVCRKVRDYHNFEWDMGKETDFVTRFPEARNRVNWDQVYGSWQQSGFETDVCVMFNDTPPDLWKDLPKDAQAYGLALARAFGPSSPKKLVSSVEIGNEPGNYDDEQYQRLFESLANGLRAGDPQLKVATCNMTVGKSGKYEKSVACVAGLESLYDVLTIHTYAMAEGWPTWKRSYPEDPKIDFLKPVEALITWRNAHANGKEIWVTEFGWDASTKPNLKTGDFAKWEGNVSDEKQAQYLVRAFLVFAALDVGRAYLYFFNDADEPSFHASSGITRNFVPKPSFHALAHLYKTLAEYRFHRILRKTEGDVYAYEFIHGSDPKKKIIVFWSPTGSGRRGAVDLSIGAAAKIVQTERMPLTAGNAAPIRTKLQSGTVHCELDESPGYLWIEE
ncbi:MAG TPA: hypothetical protein VGM05_13470 [Planctomycetaceae bacterium]|jgi:hypothetical protein